MKISHIYVCLAVVVSSCSQSAKHENPNINPESVLKDFNRWWAYNYKNINLSENYTALDTSSQEITKDTFLQSLSTGKYVAFRLATNDSSFKYKLYRLDTQVDNNITETVKNFGETAYQQYKMEGTPIPNFNFTDLNGKVYNKETTKGKIVVLKCWFIHCSVCVTEMPALNKIVKQYIDRDDIVFVSMAYDPKDSLAVFLTKRAFYYAVVPVEKKYLEEKLMVEAYPTHIVVNRQGLIANVSNEYKHMLTSLKNELSK